MKKLLLALALSTAATATPNSDNMPKEVDPVEDYDTIKPITLYEQYEAFKELGNIFATDDEWAGATITLRWNKQERVIDRSAEAKKENPVC